MKFKRIVCFADLKVYTRASVQGLPCLPGNYCNISPKLQACLKMFFSFSKGGMC